MIDHVTLRVEGKQLRVARLPAGKNPITFRMKPVETALVSPGESFIIGGLSQENVIQTKTKIPLLGDIPLLGQAFRTDRKSQSKTELYIVVTPHIVHRDDVRQAGGTGVRTVPTTTTTVTYGPSGAQPPAAQAQPQP